MTGKALVAQLRPTNVISVRNAKLPITLAVLTGMQKVLACFAPQPKETDEDLALVLTTWAEEMAEFLPEIQAEALHGLLRNNPRNPFRPSIQDLIERCEKVQRKHAERIVEWYCSKSDEPVPEWCQPLVRAALEPRLAEWLRWYKPDGYGRSPCHSVTPLEYCGWRIANEIARRIAEWPSDLLAKHQVLTGADYDRVNALILAAQERKRLKGARASEWQGANSEARRLHEFYWRNLSSEEKTRAVCAAIHRDPAAYPELAKQLSEEGAITRSPDDEHWLGNSLMAVCERG